MVEPQNLNFAGFTDFSHGRQGFAISAGGLCHVGGAAELQRLTKTSRTISSASAINRTVVRMLRKRVCSSVRAVGEILRIRGCYAARARSSFPKGMAAVPVATIIPQAPSSAPWCSSRPSRRSRSNGPGSARAAIFAAEKPKRA